MSTRKIQARNIREGDRVFIDGRWVTAGTVQTFTIVNYSHPDDDFPDVIVQGQVNLLPTQVIRKETE